jgi:hypothetical protein
VSESAAPSAAPAAPNGAAPPTAAEQMAAIPDPPAPKSKAKDSRSRAVELAQKHFDAALPRDMAPPAEAAPAKDAAPAAKEKPAKAEAEAEAEPAKADEKKTPEDEAAAAKLAEKKAADAALDKSWREVHRRKKQQRDERMALLQQRATVEREKAEAAAIRAERDADEKLKKEDPPAWLEKHRFDFREVAQDAVRKQAITPEQKAHEDAMASVRAELAAEKAAREALEKETRELIEERKAEAAERKRREAYANLTAENKREWTSAQADFPTLAKHYTPDEIAEAATAVLLKHYEKTQREAPLDEVFAHLEKNAAKLAGRFVSRSTESERTERETVDPKGSKTRAKGGPPVTNRDAATRASPATPLSDAEKRARAVERYRDLMPRR